MMGTLAASCGGPRQFHQGFRVAAVVIAASLLSFCCETPTEQNGDIGPPCTKGDLGCGCLDGTCAPGLVCSPESSTCIETPPCQEGTPGCPCLGTDGCVVGYRCESGICVGCAASLGDKYQPLETLCDNIDNDCDGEVDEFGCVLAEADFLDMSPPLDFPWYSGASSECKALVAGSDIIYVDKAYGVVALDDSLAPLWTYPCNSYGYQGAFPYVADSWNNLYAGCEVEETDALQVVRLDPNGAVKDVSDVDHGGAVMQESLMPPMALVEPYLLVRDGDERNCFYVMPTGNLTEEKKLCVPDGLELYRPVGSRSAQTFYMAGGSNGQVKKVFAVQPSMAQVFEIADVSQSGMLKQDPHPDFLTDTGLILTGEVFLQGAVTLVDLSGENHQSCEYEVFPWFMTGDERIFGRWDNQYPYAAYWTLCQADCAPVCSPSFHPGLSGPDYSGIDIGDPEDVFFFDDHTLLLVTGSNDLELCSLDAGACDVVPDSSGKYGTYQHLTVSRQGVAYSCGGTKLTANQVTKATLDDKGWPTYHHDERNTRSR